MSSSVLAHRLRAFLLCLVLGLLAGCATTGSHDPRDPLEGMNRSFYSFNDFMDRALFDPVGKVYRTLVPDPLDRGISNVFSNVNDIAVVANDLLQFKFAQAWSDFWRLFLNSTLGLAGLFDVATGMGFPKHNEDLGQTLARWGIGSGPYLVAPFFGPMTVRDAFGYGVENMFMTPVAYINDEAYRAGVLSLNYVDFKSDLKSGKELMEDAALDEYEFLKNAYLERRENLVHDRDFNPDQYEDDGEE